MKKSELKDLINEVIEEISESDPLAQKFFLAAYNHIKKNGQKKTHHNQLSGPTQGDWAGETWTLGDVKARDLNQHYSRAVSSPKVSALMDRKGSVVWERGSLDDLKELLVSISEQKVNELQGHRGEGVEYMLYNNRDGESIAFGTIDYIAGLLSDYLTKGRPERMPIRGDLPSVKKAVRDHSDLTLLQVVV